MQTSNKKNSVNLKWIISAIRPYWGLMFLITALIIIFQALQVWETGLFRNIIDAAVSRDRDFFIRQAVSLLAVLASLAAFSVFKNYLQERINSQITLHFQKRLFHTLLMKDYTDVTGKHSGEWMNRMITDTENASSSVVKIFSKILASFVDVICSVWILYQIIPILTIALVISSLSVGLAAYFLRSPFRKRQQTLRKAEGEERVFFTERLSNLLIIKAFSQETAAAEQADRMIKKVFEQHLNKIKLSVGVKTVFDITNRLIYFGAIVYGAYNIFTGRISLGSFAVINRLWYRVRNPLTDINSYIMSIWDLSVSAERLREAEAYEDDRIGSIKDDDTIRSFYNEQFSEIIFKEAAFRYPDKDETDEPASSRIFQHVNLTIPKGSMTAVTGITGSGKSTLFKLLMSFYPLDEGEKFIRTTDGNNYPLDASYRRLFAYVPQGNQLMAGTIRDIVSFGTAGNSTRDEVIWKALDLACAKDFVEALPDGLDTEIKEKGLGLSEGQLQRIAIARAIYTERPVLLLDEATGSLDEGTEERLLQNLRTMENRTILITTHRPKVLSICDSEIHINNEHVTMHSLQQHCA